MVYFNKLNNTSPSVEIFHLSIQGVSDFQWIDVLSNSNLKGTHHVYNIMVKSSTEGVEVSYGSVPWASPFTLLWKTNRNFHRWSVDA